MKKITAALLLVCLFAFIFQVPALGALSVGDLRGTELYVYNWGEYISDGSEGSLDVNKAFEEKYGIKVIYDTFDNNEVMYTKLKGGGVSYDVIIPSDYMIERMVAESMLQKIDFTNVPNYKNIDAKYKDLPFDPTNEYSVPYNVGTIGLLMPCSTCLRTQRVCKACSTKRDVAPKCCPVVQRWPPLLRHRKSTW